MKLKWFNRISPRTVLPREELVKRMEESVKLLCEEAKALCPERTGALRASLTWEVSEDGKKGWYGSNRPWRGEESVKYAYYQEVGFKHWRSGRWVPGFAYLRGPLYTKRPEIQSIWSGARIRIEEHVPPRPKRG